MATLIRGEIGDSFQVAAGSIDITPDAPLPLAGYSGRRAPFTEVVDRLEANAVVLRCGGATCAFLSFDLLYVSGEIRNAVAASIAEHIASQDLFISASHTHFAPATDRHLPILGLATDDYISRVAERAAFLLRDLLGQTSAPLVITYATGIANHSINRRLPVFGLRRDLLPLRTRWEMRPNPDGSRDEAIRLFAIREPGGAPKAICWSYACHPVCFPRTDCVSADFPGVVRRALRTAYGPIPVVYWQGFSGDTRPCTVRPASRGLLGYPIPPAFVPFTNDGWTSWSTSLASRVVGVSQTPGRTLEAAIRSSRRTVAMSDLGPDTGGRDLSVQEISLGPDLSIFGVSAEIVSAYSGLLCRTRAPADVIPVGCLDGVPGYIPTSEMVPQGGYEAKKFMKLFGVKGSYRPDVTNIVEHRVFGAGEAHLYD